MIVAIDGPAGSGKSTIAHEIAERYGFTKLDTGAMYRAVAYVASRTGVDLDEGIAVAAMARELRFFFDSSGEETRISVNGHDVSRQIRSPEVDRIVSKVAAYPGVRMALLGAQRAVAEGCDVVAEGRDVGTVVFPNAELKIFLTADPHERAHRRVLQRHEGEAELDEAGLAAEEAETYRDLERRDALDASRAVAPLEAAPDAVTIDSSSRTIDEVVELIGALIDERR